MRQDVIDAMSARFPGRIPTKETLNHPGLVRRVSGLDPWEESGAAFAATWRKLSIDVHADVPDRAPRPRVAGGTWEENGWRYADIGVFPTSVRIWPPEEAAASVAPFEAAGPDGSSDWPWRYDPSADDIDLAAESARLRAANATFRSRYGELAVHYDSYYTTLFMWPVVRFDWEPFLSAAGSDPERFDRRFWQPWAAISRRRVQALASVEEEVVFVHDDLAMSSGPVFAPAFYDRWIFPRYPDILEPAVRAGKLVVFISDGNIDVFLERLLAMPFAGIMFENPATPWERVLATWGEAGRGFIGGIDTRLLTVGSAEEVRAHTRATIEAGRRYPGFVLASCGGLHGGVPLENILAYFETRDALGIPAEV